MPPILAGNANPLLAYIVYSLLQHTNGECDFERMRGAFQKRWSAIKSCTSRQKYPNTSKGAQAAAQAFPEISGKTTVEEKINKNTTRKHFIELHDIIYTHPDSTKHAGNSEHGLWVVFEKPQFSAQKKLLKEMSILEVFAEKQSAEMIKHAEEMKDLEDLVCREIVVKPLSFQS